MPLYLHTLGQISLTRSSGDLISIRRKPLALLVFLARRAPRAVSRTELATLIWGDSTEKRARQSLRQALLELKQSVGVAIDVSTHVVSLADGAIVLDLVEFERDTKAGRLDAALARWEGDFFPNAADVGGEGFERWVDSERALAVRKLGVLMERLIDDAELRGDSDAAMLLASRWAAAAPFDEHAHVRRIELLRIRGHAAEALDCHVDFVGRMRSALDVEPSAEFLGLERGLHELVRIDWLHETRTSSALHSPSLVGRDLELAELNAAWRAAATIEPRIILVEDAGGGGKTRLLDDFVKSISEHPEGRFVLRARGESGEGEPYATARRLFAGLRDAPGSAGASPASLGETAWLVPSLAASLPHLPAPSGNHVALRDALVDMLAAVSEEAPVLIALDDVHFADETSRLLVASIAGHLRGRVLVVLLADEGASEPRTAIATLLAVRGLARIRLRPLSVDDVAAMVTSMLRIAESDRARLAARLHEESLGAPFLVYELVVSLVQEQLLALDTLGEWHLAPSFDSRPLPLPASVRERIRPGLASLSPAARTLLETIAVLGAPVDGVLLERVSGLSSRDASRALRELVTLHLVMERVEMGQIDLTHPVLGRATYASLSPSARQALRVRVAQVTETRDTTASTDLI